MDEAEKQELLNEFLVKWIGGTSAKAAEADLLKKGVPQSDLAYCRKIFEKWAEASKTWSDIKKMKI